MNIYDDNVRWLVQAPVVIGQQLAALCRASVSEVDAALAQLVDAGWLFERAVEGRPGGDSLVSLSPAAVRFLSKTPGAGGLHLGPLPPWELTVRALGAALIAEPVTRILNAALAATATAAADEGGSLTQAIHRQPKGSKPRPMPGETRIPLGWGHMEIRLRLDGKEARCVLHVDRAAVPMTRRAWLGNAIEEAWAAEAAEHATPVLILCPDVYELDQWLELLKEVPGSLPPIGLGLQADVCGGFGLRDPVWRPAKGQAPVSLHDLLCWEPLEPVPDASAMDSGLHGSCPPPIAQPDAALSALLHVNAANGPTEHAAACVLSLDWSQRKIAHLLAVQPWLAALDIGRWYDAPAVDIELQLAALDTAGAIAAVMGPDGEQRWTITERWLSVEACRTGEGRYWQGWSGALKVPRTQGGEWSPKPTLHRVGVARCIGLAAAAARDVGLTIEDWRSEAWWCGDVGKREPVPDAVCRLRAADGRPIVALLEYERVSSGAQGSTKMRQWGRWYAEERWRDLRGPAGSPAGPPVVLIVYDGNSTHRGSLIRAIQGAPEMPLYAVSEEEFARGGFRSPVWLHAGGGTGSLPVTDLD